MRGLLLVAVIVALGLPSNAVAQTTMLDGFGGAAGYGTECLGPNDDGSSMGIDLTPIFGALGLQFFDRNHDTMFVNTNGNVSFNAGVPDYTPDAFPIADQPMIAPYWADVDIRGGLCDSYPDGRARGGGDTYAGDCQDPSSNGVWWHLDAAGSRVIVTWHRVGYYRCHTSPRMSFQLVLTAVGGGEACGGGSDFDVEFRFAECGWNTGDASGGMGGLPRDPAVCVRAGVGPWRCPIGAVLRCENMGGTRTCSAVPAQSGFDAGNTADFVEIAGSRTATIHTTLCTGSNVGEPGVWRFQIRSGVIGCPDAGDPCDTGLSGACATGRTQCVGGGTECRPEVPPVAEDCDALDDDCDGMVDEGDLCPIAQVCDRGICVSNCFEGGCLEGEVCTTEGRCVDMGCEDTSCPEGERCVAGGCVGACDGVTCPAGRDCRAGRCVDLCSGAVCNDCSVCEGGDCVPSCAHAACPSGETCLDDGRCVEDACATVSCEPGSVCRGGSCVDACDGATCPSGEICQTGECIDPDRPDAGSMVLPDGGTSTSDGGGTTPGMDGGIGPTDPMDDGGCGCRAVATPRSGSGALLLLLAIGLFARRRRSTPAGG